MSSTEPGSTTGDHIYALIDYEDPYVQPLIVDALNTHLSPETYTLITSSTELPSPTSRLLQIRQYESIDFDHLLSHPITSIANAYIIRKALIRKHYLSTTVRNWVTKYPDSVLSGHVKEGVEFEVDYAEFLDDALVEAWELQESWSRGEGLDERGRDWWILKPGMSERGQGIRLFSSEEELVSIFEGWDPASDNEEDDEDGDANADSQTPPTKSQKEGDGIVTSLLRHFIAQPYIHPPLLLHPPTTASPTSSTPGSHKFHIRTYVLALSSLKIFVYRPMLALFAARPYEPPWESAAQMHDDPTEALRGHLTNTCLQESGEREGSVGLFWELPNEFPAQPQFASATPSQPTRTSASSAASASTQNWKEVIFQQICAVTGSAFEAAARSSSIHFQALPNAFEIFGLDFLVSLDSETEGGVKAWLLEVNAFPDFRQTGDELKGVIEGLWGEVVRTTVSEFFGVGAERKADEEAHLVKVLDIDLGRR